MTSQQNPSFGSTLLGWLVISPPLLMSMAYAGWTITGWQFMQWISIAFLTVSVLIWCGAFLAYWVKTDNKNSDANR